MAVNLEQTTETEYATLLESIKTRIQSTQIRAFYGAYLEIVPQAVGRIPWGHNAVLLEQLKILKHRIWYAQKTIEHGWSRSILAKLGFVWR